ncbi:MAG: oligosaccharide flippase family protein [Bacteroidota bacterium]
MRSEVPSELPERSLVRNSLFNGLGFVWSAAVLFFQVTYILHALGAEIYGIWALCLILSSTFTIADFGMSATIVKFVSEYRAKGQLEEVNRVLANSLLFYLAIDVAILPLVLVIPAILEFLSVPGDLLPLAVTGATIALLNFMLTMTGVNILAGLLQGYHRMDVTNRVTMAIGIPKIMGTIAAIELGYGLLGVMVSDFLMVFLTVAVLRHRAAVIVPGAVFAVRYRSWSTFKAIFRFGITLQASMISGLINFHFDKLVLSKFLGLAFLTYYDLGSRVVGKIRGLPLIVATALLPEFSRLQALQDLASIREVYDKSSKVMLVFLLPVFGTIALVSDLLVNLWLGPGYELAALTLRVLAFSYCVNVFTAVVSNASKGLGHPEIEAKTAGIQVVLNVLLSPLLVLQFGFPGALIGTSIALVGGAAYYMVKVNRLLGVRWSEFTAKILRQPLLFSAASLILAGGTLILGVEAGLGTSFEGRAALLVGVSIISMGLFYTLLLKSSYIDPSERARWKRAWRQILPGR